MKEYSDEELANMHWKERWEYEAQREAERQSALSEDDLLEYLRQGLLDFYFQLWDTFAEKGTLRKSALPLWEFLRDHPGEDWMLNRYHCAAALFAILGMPDPGGTNELRSQVQWDHQGEEARQQALLRLKTIILQKIE
jgi:hypothetical protein